MTGSLILLIQALLYFTVMTGLFRLRRQLGIGVFLCALGVMHFLETYLAASFFVELPFGLISPGSTALFAGKLAMILLIYIKEDAETVRQPIYGLLVGNGLMMAFVLILKLIEPSAHAGTPDMALLDQIGALMIWGTILLFIDSIALVLLYERFSNLCGGSVVARSFTALAIALTFDQVLFFIGLTTLADAPASAFIGGWVAKMGAAVVYSLLIGAYMRWAEAHAVDAEGQPVADVFATLTYRKRYEDLLAKSGIDALTGVLNRERFESLGRSTVARAVAGRRPFSLAMVDIDHFKQVNDKFGHQVGDEVLKRVGQVLRDSVRADDKVFRYGGEEFVIFWDGLAHEAALANAERLRMAVPVALQQSLPTAPTVSVGVATTPSDATDLAALVEKADARLYQAKRNGRNRVVGNRVSI